MPKKTTSAFALVVMTGASIAMAIAPAGAADINDPYYDDDRGAFNAEPYDDPRYADMYGDPQPRYRGRQYTEDKSPYRDDGYDERDYASKEFDDFESKDYVGKDYESDRYGGKYFSDRYDDDESYVPKGSLKDDDYLSEFDAPPKYTRVPRGGYACVGRHQVRRILRADGWAPIRRIIMKSHDEAIVFARRGLSGRAYALRFDTCDCKITDVQPLNVRRPRPWAWNTPRRNWRHHF